MHPLLQASATELAARIRTREVTSREVVERHIARIREVQPRTRALVCDRFDEALAEADAADARVAAGDADLPPLHGVPCTIKEAFAVRGMPWTGGLRARVGVRADDDAPTVRRLREAGAIVLGVSNLSELCMWMESDNPVYGRTSNPYDPRRTAGGSSGGEGALVGAGASPFGLGSDVGGSIRMPAFFNGVFGHKPSAGLVPNVGQFPCNTSVAGLELLTSGPLARRATDLMPLLRVLAGACPDDPLCQHDLPLGDPSAVRLDALQVIDVPDLERGGVDPELQAVQARVADHLRSRGAQVRSASFPLLRHALDIWSTAMADAEGPGAFRKLLQRPRRRDLLPHLLRPAELGGEHTVPAVLLGLIEDVGSLAPRRAARTRELRSALRQELLDAMGPQGVLLFPSHPRPAPRHRTPWLRPFGWVYTAVFNALGFPVTQVPLGLGSLGVPLGLQVVGRPGDDHVPIAVAEQLEADGVAGWVPPST